MAKVVAFEIIEELDCGGVTYTIHFEKEHEDRPCVWFSWYTDTQSGLHETEEYPSDSIFGSVQENLRIHLKNGHAVAEAVSVIMATTMEIVNGSHTIHEPIEL